MDLPNLEHPVIAIIGAGAVGGYYGARLAHNGLDVHFLMRGDYEAVKKAGFTVQSCAGDFVLPSDKLNLHDDPTRMPKADLVIVALKSTANDQFDRLIRPLLKAGTIVLTVQNGFGNEDMLADLFGAQRVLGGIAFVCINRLGPGVISHTAHGLIRIGDYVPHESAVTLAAATVPPADHALSPAPTLREGPGALTEMTGADPNRADPGSSHMGDRGESSPTPFPFAVPDPSRDPRAAATRHAAGVAALFNPHGVPCEILPDLRAGRWNKLMWNIPFNGLSAVMDQTTDRLLASPAGMKLVRRLMREVIDIARADGVTLPAELIDKQISNTLEMGAYRTSSHIDRLEKRPLELEALWGRPLRVARAAGVAAPTLEMLYEMLCATDAVRKG